MASAALGSRRKQLRALAAVTRCIANNDKLSCLINADFDNSPPSGEDEFALLQNNDLQK